MGAGEETDERGDDEPRVSSLEDLLDRLGEGPDQEERVTVDFALDLVGRRSFGPLVLLAGIITLVPPIGGIPGVPTMAALLVLLVAVQLLLARDHFWLPRWLLDRSVEGDKLAKAIEWVRRPALFFDRQTSSRLKGLVRGPGVRVIAVACLLIALGMPPMEFIPFSATGAGVALTAFGLALIATDGLLALIGLAVTVITFGIIGYTLFF